jgi:predicted MFS family arabinose efflux permease
MYSPTATASGAALAPPEKRAQALAVVIAGLSSATALGSPLGSFIGSLGNWRDTLWFVSAVGLVAAVAVHLMLPAIAALPSASLRQRLAPLRDSRVALTLLTTLAAYAGMFSVYTYMGVSFDRATGGRPEVLAGLLLLWGVAATVGNLAAGRLTDRYGSRVIINGAIAVLVLNFLAMPWTSATLPTAAIALVIWGLCGWGLVVPQQARLISIAPAAAPLLMGLNSAALYVGVSIAGVAGATGITLMDRHLLGLIAAIPIMLALVLAQLASRHIKQSAYAAAVPA